MGLFVLELALAMLGIRGPLPYERDYRPFPTASSSGFGSTRLLLILAACAAALTVFALALWAAVWMAIRLP